MIDLRLGDCLEVMKEIPDNSIDLILTDPPYGTTACKWDIIIPFDDMWKELKRIRKDNTAIVLFGSEPFSSHLRLSNIKEFKYDWIWHKNRQSGIASAKKRPMCNYEIISIFYKSQCNYYPIFEEYSESVNSRFSKNINSSGLSFVNNIKANKRNESNNIEKLKKIASPELDFKRGKYPSRIKFFKTPNNSNSQRFHPTQKPVALLEYLIKTYTLENELVLDFTMGSFSTAIACLNTKRQFVGIEKDAEYFKIGTDRIEKHLSNLDYIPKIVYYPE